MLGNPNELSLCLSGPLRASSGYYLGLFLATFASTYELPTGLKTGPFREHKWLANNCDEQTEWAQRHGGPKLACLNKLAALTTC